MNGDALGFAHDTGGLRERNVSVRARTEDEARTTVLNLNALEERTRKGGHSRKTYGRTPDGIG
jgi:hypothetical protein